MLFCVDDGLSYWIITAVIHCCDVKVNYATVRSNNCPLQSCWWQSIQAVPRWLEQIRTV